MANQAQWKWIVRGVKLPQLETALNNLEGDGWEVYDVLCDSGPDDDNPTSYTVIGRQKAKA